MAHMDSGGGSGKRGTLKAKEGRSAGKIMAGGGARCNGGRGYKTGGRRPGGGLVGGGKGKSTGKKGMSY